MYHYYYYYYLFVYFNFLISHIPLPPIFSLFLYLTSFFGIPHQVFLFPLFTPLFFSPGFPCFFFSLSSSSLFFQFHFLPISSKYKVNLNNKNANLPFLFISFFFSFSPFFHHHHLIGIWKSSDIHCWRPSGDLSPVVTPSSLIHSIFFFSFIHYLLFSFHFLTIKHFFSSLSLT